MITILFDDWKIITAKIPEGTPTNVPIKTSASVRCRLCRDVEHWIDLWDHEIKLNGEVTDALRCSRRNETLGEVRLQGYSFPTMFELG